MRRISVFAFIVSPLLFCSSTSVAEAPVNSPDAYTKLESPTQHRGWVEPIFGPEFTFMHWNSETQAMENAGHFSKYKSIYLDHLTNHLVNGQPPDTQFLQDDHVFHSPEKWTFSVGIDPGVVEVTMTPQNFQFFSEHSSNIQDAIFDSARALSLYPAMFGGGGHINIGRNVFDADALLLRNFFVDFFNHSELAQGIMAYDTRNALPLTQLHPEKIRQLKAAIAEFDTHYSHKMEPQDQQTEKLFNDLNAIISNSELPDHFNSNADTRGSKFFALSFTNFGASSTEESSQRRLEVRCVRPQASFDVFLRQIRLLRNRLLYLKTLNKPIPFKPMVHLILQRAGRNDLFDPPVSPQQALKAFYLYVTESGEKWADHRDYLWPAWVHPIDKTAKSELKRFEKSWWFQRHEKKVRKRMDRNLQRELNINHTHLAKNCAYHLLK